MLLYNFNESRWKKEPSVTGTYIYLYHTKNDNLVAVGRVVSILEPYTNEVSI